MKRKSVVHGSDIPWSGLRAVVTQDEDSFIVSASVVTPGEARMPVGKKVVSTLPVSGHPEVRLRKIAGAELDRNFNNICVRSFILTGAPANTLITVEKMTQRQSE